MIFYLIDLRVCGPEEFVEQCVDVDGGDIMDAAEEWACVAFDEDEDGQTVEVRIATTREGKDAIDIVVTQHVAVTYTAKRKQ